MDVAQKTKKRDKTEYLLIDKNCFLRFNPKLKTMVRENLLPNHGFCGSSCFSPGSVFADAGEIGDELLSRTAGAPAVAHGPGHCLPVQFVAPEQDLGIPFHQGVHDVEELLVIRLEVADGDAEAVGKGHLLLHRVVAVHVVGGHIGLIPPGLPHQMAAVGGGVDHHVLRLGLQSALDDGLQVRKTGSGWP